MNRRSNPGPILLSILLGAVLLRFLGLKFGLPVPVFSDESHHINVAVSFGSGNLNPHIFKYPTLWMYVLFAAYGALFAVWSGLGLLHSTADFASLFVWSPAWFYLTARIVTAVAGVITVIFVYLAARTHYESRRAGWVAGGLAAFCPYLIYYGHQAKPDTMMTALVAAAIYFLIVHQKSGSPRPFYLGCALLGLSCSTQYTAAVAVPYLFFAGILSGSADASSRIKKILRGGFLVVTFFFLASPFILIDWMTFWGDLASLRSYGSGALRADTGRAGWLVLKFYALALGPLVIGSILLAGSVFTAVFRSQKKTLAFLFPLIWTAIALALQSKEAGVENYLFPVFPFLFLLVGGLGAELEKLSPPLRTGLSLALIAPCLFSGAGITHNFLKPDTRPAATRWIETNIPAGTKILLDQPHTAPALYPTQQQAERLLEKTKAHGNARWKYFDAMLRSHPGGGHEIIRLERTWKEILSPLERQTKAAKEGQETLDVEAGIEAMRQVGVSYFVWSARGATLENSPRLEKFLTELETEARVVKEFTPTSSYSPLIKIYEVSPDATVAKK